MSEELPKQTKVTAAEAEALVREFGLIYSNLQTYGSSHPVTQQSIEACYANVTGLLGRMAEVAVSVTDDAIGINGTALELKNRMIQALADQLLKLDVTSFAFQAGIDEKNFSAFVEVLTAKPDEIEQLGGLPGYVQTLGIEYVKTRKVVYREVAEDEVVVSREQLEAAGAGADGEKKEHVRAVLAFLKGGSGNEAPPADLGANPDELAELIMHAAEIRQEEAGLSQAETFSSLVVGCLRRAYEGLNQSPEAKSQRGRKDLEKTLLILEKDLLDRLHEMSRDGLEVDDRDVQDAMEELKDDVRIDALASEYLKKKHAIEKSEERILRYIQRRGLEQIEESDLAEKLEDGGLTPDGWRELLVKSGLSEPEEAQKGVGLGPGLGGLGESAAAGDNGGGSPFGILGTLASLLADMEDEIIEHDAGAKGEASGGLSGALQEAAHDGTVDLERLHHTIARIGSELAKVGSEAENNLQQLVESAHEEAEERTRARREGREPRKPRLSRRKLFEILAELGQEICQQLAVINCSVQMILSKNLGDISQAQQEMLSLVDEGSQKLHKIADKLIDIAGMPESRSPDAQIQSSIYAPSNSASGNE